MEIVSGIIFLILFFGYIWRRAYQLNGGCSDIGEFFSTLLIFIMLISVGIGIFPLAIIFMVYDIFTSIKEKIKQREQQ